MLILKGNWSIATRFFLLCLLLAAAARAAPPVVLSPEPGRAPDVVAAEFYGWYLDVLAADQDPLSDRHERFAAYVARELTQRLVERLQKAPPPDLDYFLQARGYEPAWRRAVRTALLRRERGGAEVLVTLGGGEGPARALVLTMVAENGAWKIRQVRAALKSGAESSPEQLAI